MASIYKRGKTWTYKVYYYENGKQKAVSKGGFKTKGEAKDASILRENEMLQGKNFSKEKMLLADYMENWANLYKDGTIAFKSMRRLRTITAYVREYYNVPLKDITIDNYQQFLNTLALTRSKPTVKKYHDYVKACIKHAIQSKILIYDPTSAVVIKGNDERTKDEEIKHLSYTEFKALHEAIMDGLQPEYTARYVILLGMYTGARFGECLGLTWDCIDFENCTIRIEKGFDYHYTNDFTDGKTKNSKRTIEVNRELLDVLQQLPRDNEDDRVFTRMSNNAVNKTLEHALKRAGIEKVVTFHALRHTHASILLSQGVQLLTVSRRLGHADANITLKTYAHILDDMKIKEAQKIKEILTRGTFAEQKS